MKITKTLLVVGIAAFALSCSSEQKPKKKYFFSKLNHYSSKPKVRGRLNEVVVVSDSTTRKTIAWDVFKYIQEIDFEGVPFAENKFSTMNFLPKDTGLVKMNHTHLYLNLGDKNSFKLEKDIYAFPQLFIRVTAKSYDEMASILKKYKNEILKEVKNNSLRVSIHSTKYSKEVNEISKSIDKDFIRIPEYYQKVTNTNEIFWYRHFLTKDGHQNLWGTTIHQDSIKKPEDIITWRNAFVKNHIQGGDVKHAYMTTESHYTPSYDSFKKDDLHVVFVKSLWKLEGDYMGGSFVGMYVRDKKNSTSKYYEGFVYAPTKPHGVYVTQLESYLKTLYSNTL